MILSYVRNKVGQRVGVVVAIGPGVIGWSKLNKSDKWNNELGIKIAVGRANTGTNIQVPHIMNNTIENMINRSFKYFKPVEV